MFKIGEFSVLTSISIHMLRNYDKIGLLTSIPSCEVASLVYQGGYSRLKDINIYIAKWITQSGFEICGSAFNIYYISPEHEANEEKFITEVCFPIKKR